MLLLVASILTIVTVTGLLLAGQAGVLIALFSKPIIDATWDSNLGGFNLLQIIAVVFPAVILMKAFASQQNHISRIPIYKLWLVHIIYTTLTFLFYAIEKSLIAWIDMTFRLLNGLAGYYILQA